LSNINYNYKVSRDRACPKSVGQNVIPTYFYNLTGKRIFGPKRPYRRIRNSLTAVEIQEKFLLLSITIAGFFTIKRRKI
jgi:hypothetical protein